MNGRTTTLQHELAQLLDASTISHIAAHTGLYNRQVTGRAIELALPTVLRHLADFARSSTGPATLRGLAAQVPLNLQDALETTDIASLIFGDDLVGSASDVARAAQISTLAGQAIVKATSVWALLSARSLVARQSDPDAISDLFIRHGTMSQATATRHEPEPETPEQPVEPAPTAPAAPAQVTPAPAKSTSGAMSGKLIGALLVLLAIIALAAYFLLAGRTEDRAGAIAVEGVSENENVAVSRPAEFEPAATGDATAAVAPSEPEAPAPGDAPTTTTTTSATAPAPDVANPAITALSIPLRDISSPGTDAGESVNATFNTLSGEICFTSGSTTSSQSGTVKIHSGDFGVAGAALAEPATIDGNGSGCITNSPATTAAILAAPSRHYVEVQPADGSTALRGQVSETVDRPGIVPFVIPMRDILGASESASGVLNFDFDTNTGEICYSVFSVGVEGPYATHIHAGNFGVKGGVVLDMGASESGATGCVQNERTDTLSILADPSGHYAEIHDVGGEWTVRGQLTETVENPGIVTLAVPMVDILDVEPSAQGTLTFDFNTVTGQICYDVSAVNITPPFAAHIHAGAFGVKGGVVVDLGGLSDGAAGCVSSAQVDTLAILANPGAHYAELHDAAGVWTIRGQLSEASAAIDPNSNNLLIDTDGGGASIRLEDSAIFVEGFVASEAVAEEMLQSLENLSVPVINNLQIRDDAPPPSGRIIIADAVFFAAGSSEVNALEATTLTPLVEVADSRPDWLLTVVGHTDNIGNEVANLELSLRRAEALRDLLVGQGMNGTSIRVRGAGETAPIASNDTEAGRAQNRRIEFEFIPA